MSVDFTIDAGSILGVSTGTISSDARKLIRERLLTIRKEVRTFLLSVWPVDSAASLQDWELRVVGLGLVIRNPIPYAIYVHRTGEVGTLVWEEIRDEANDLVDQAIPDMQFIIEQNPKSAGTEEVATFVSAPAVTYQSLINSVLFRAKQRALVRVPILTRDGIRKVIDNRRRLTAADLINRGRN